MVTLIRVLILLILFSSPAYSDVIWSDDFENASTPSNYSQWLQNGNCNTGTTIARHVATSTAVYEGSYGSEILYHLDDDPRGDCQLHQDNNTSHLYSVSSNDMEYSFRGYFKVKATGTAGAFCNTPTIQRKLVYFKPTGWGSGAYAFFIGSWPYPSGESGCNSGGYQLSIGLGSAGGTGTTIWGSDSRFNQTTNHILENTWYYVRVDVEYGTLGNDKMDIYFEEAGNTPVKIFSETNLGLRSSDDISNTRGLGLIEVGRQVDVNRASFDLGHIDEYRYWDDLELTDTFGDDSSDATIQGISGMFNTN